MNNSRINSLRGTRYEARAVELLSDAECTVIDNDLGVLVSAPIAGAQDVTRLHMLFGSPKLLDALPLARVLIAELPDDAPFHQMTTALLSNGFREEGRITDFVAEGIAMRFLVKRQD